MAFDSPENINNAVKIFTMKFGGLNFFCIFAMYLRRYMASKGCGSA